MRVVVVGLGAMGLPTAWALAERGHAVVGLDRHGIGSPLGSSAGGTRIFRLAHDRPSDVRLARRALERWRGLEAASGATIIDPVGLLVRGAGAAAYASALRAEGVPCDDLDDAAVATAFPELARRPGEPALLVPGDGVVMARRGLEAMAVAARAAGAELAAPERVVAIAETTAGVRVETDHRVLEADAAVVAAGPWASALLEPAGLRLPLQPAIGQVTYWRGGDWRRRPALIDFPAEGRMGVYGLPAPDVGYKIGLDYGDEDAWRPDAEAWPVRAGEERENAAWVAAHAPGLATDGPHASECCPWTMTPDGDFLYGRRGAIVVAAGCCGHGFKHAPVLGEVLADLAEGRPLDPDAAPWALERLPPDAAFERVETPMGARIAL